MTIEYIDRMPSMTEYAEGKRIDPKHTDLISRADAIEAVRKCIVESELLADWNKAMESAQELLSALPSADADQVRSKLKKPCDSLLTDDSAECKEHKSKLESADAVQGEWLEIEDYNGDYHYQCSVCKDEFYLEYGTPKENGYAYCPSCGSRMYKGGDDE